MRFDSFLLQNLVTHKTLLGARVESVESMSSQFQSINIFIEYFQIVENNRKLLQLGTTDCIIPVRSGSIWSTNVVSNFYCDLHNSLSLTLSVSLRGG